MEFPYPPIAPSMHWWPEDSAAAAPVQSVSEKDLITENAMLRARVQALEAQLGKSA